MSLGQLHTSGLGRISTARLADLLHLEDRERPGSTEIAARIRQLVVDGRLGVAVLLPAERSLADRLGVSRGMITAAYTQLRRDGWADARQGSGTWTSLPDQSAGASIGSGAWAPDAARPDILDLAHAAPSAPPQLASAFAAALHALPRELPTHGYYPAGLPELRARIAERYDARGLKTAPEQVLVTSGALHAITLVLEVLCRRGDRVLIEHPTYPSALDAIRRRGARLVEAAVEPVESFVPAVADVAGSARPVLAYLMPNVHNPTGRVLDDRAGDELAAALLGAGAVPLIDETLVDLHLDVVESAPRVGVWSDGVLVGSLSKSVWGGLRIGWIRARSELVRAFTAAAARASLAGPVVEQLAACRLFDALDDVLTLRLAELRERRDALRSALTERLPEWGVPSPSAGLALWCRLPERSSSALALAAEPHGLRLAPGSLFGTGGAFEDRLRVPFTLPGERLQQAVEILAYLDGEVPRRTRIRRRSTVSVV